MSIKVRSEREFTYQSERLLSANRYGSGPTIEAWGRYATIDQSRPGTIEHFLTERYCLFTTNRSGQLLRGRYSPHALAARGRGSGDRAE
jgi:uncharacterized protein YqjF (DUF2071 family)